MIISNLEVADLLERAADLYESEQIEWCQNGFFNSNDGEPDIIPIRRMFGPDDPTSHTPILSACAWGALILAGVQGDEVKAWRLAGGLGNRESVEWVMVERARLAIEFKMDDANGTPQFNDTPGRTKQEVIDLMKDTAKEWRNDA